MRWLRAGSLVTLSLLPLVIAASAAHHELRSDFRPEHAPVTIPAILAQDRIENVSFDADGHTVRGWFMAPTNGAVVVLLHGTDADRTQLAPEAHLLANHDYGVLLFDWPGHGESEGAVTWSENERTALRAALDFASHARGVDAARIGVFAFSMGTMIAIQVAARDPRVAALVVEGAFADVDDELRYEFRHWGFLSQWPALWTAHWLGMKSDKVKPIELIGSIAPRPVLVIAGAADESVPPEQSRALFDAASEPKSWWLVNGATHHHYADAEGGAAYEEKLVGFFDDSLLHRRRASALER